MSTPIQFTYENDPSKSALDATRFFVGDTDCRRPLLDDREVQFALDQVQQAPVLAAIILLNTLANRYARESDVTVGAVSKSLGQVSDVFRKRALDLEDDNSRTALPFFGGRTFSGKRALDQDSDAVPPHFRYGQGDDKGALQLDFALSTLQSLGYCGVV